MSAEIFNIHLWCTLVALLSASSCALLGTFLVLRKDSLLGDAVSHAILPGLALAFLLSGSRASIFMFIGASLFGLLTAVIAQFLNRYCKVDQGASLGVVFTTFFALGVILIRLAADKVDLDPGCVLYGLLEFTPFDTLSVFGLNLPRAFVILSFSLLFVLTFICILYKELKISSFDAVLATTLGINSNLIHFLLSAAVAIVSVASFESVGSILVVAMFIIPGSVARLLTNNYFSTLLIAEVVAVLSAVFGYYFAVQYNVPVAGMMAVVAGIIFLTTLFLAPKYGFLGKITKNISTQLNIISEDILGLIYRCSEENFKKSFPLSSRNILFAMGGGFLSQIALFKLLLSGHIKKSDEYTFSLSEKGQCLAANLIRSHRLWEAYLVKQLHLPADHVHDTAMMLEHITSKEMQKELVDETKGAKKDPHGREIP